MGPAAQAGQLTSCPVRAVYLVPVYPCPALQLLWLLLQQTGLTPASRSRPNSNSARTLSAEAWIRTSALSSWNTKPVTVPLMTTVD